MRTAFRTILVPALLAFIALPALAAAPVFTGDVEADFTTAGTIVVVDPGGKDVGVPVALPAGTISGWDLKSIRLWYDAVADTMYVGFNTFGIAGDADGDGKPGSPGPALAGLGGLDLPDMGGTESFALLLDTDEDGIWDIIAGVSASTDISDFTVATFAGNAIVPALSFGADLPAHTGALFANPSSSQPDLEFTITNFSQLANSSGGDSQLSFAINGFMGSFDDAGFGEDFAPGVGQPIQVCFDVDGDGFDTCNGDCDDSDPSIHPNGQEICNGQDDDCDTQIDEGPPACDDGDACTSGDTCIAGSCQGTSTVPCGDGNPCTLDSCLALTGCINSPNDGAPCTDGNACTQDDACQAGVCQGVGALTCDDGDVCTTDTCTPGAGCVHAPASGSACDDGDVCTDNDVCINGGCSGVPLACDDGNVCTVDVCQAGVGCTSVALADGAECGTGVCGPVCQAGECISGSDPTDYCGGVSEAGWCDGHTLTRCVDGDVQTTDCLSLGRACGWDDGDLDGAGAHDCVEQDTTCADIPDSGKCDGSLLTWCDTDDGTVHTWDCGDDAEHCGWTGSFYCCHPLDQCVPKCGGKACGDDGCGGTCGTCDGEDLCTDSGHCLACGAGGPPGPVDPGPVNPGPIPGTLPPGCTVSDACGDVSAGGRCDGHGLSRCVFGTPVTVDCPTLGGICGWNTNANQLGCVAVAQPCDGVSGIGACDGSELTTCVGGNTVIADCADTGRQCVFTGTQYECALADACVAQCKGKACGDDGCGGDCGACGDGHACSESNRCLPCGTSSMTDPLTQPGGSELGYPEGTLELEVLRNGGQPLPVAPPSTGCSAAPTAPGPIVPAVVVLLLAAMVAIRRRFAR
ncbi:MAG: hypothetical protein ACI9WU_005122 [Myxococcota bacterium]|jgi:hypothetical protein